MSDKYPKGIIIRNYGELSYHSDGSLLWKLPESKKGHKRYVDNPQGTGSRRTPLNAISKWEPVVRGNIIRYKTCHTGLTNDARVLPNKKSLFNGEPFEYYIFLGNMRYQSPPNNKPNELIYRINDIGDNLDLILWVRKSEFHGEPFEIFGRTAINNNNRVGIVEPRLQVDKSGAIEIDLKMFWDAEWNTDIVDDRKLLNIDALKNAEPLTAIGKAYLKNNPFLNQLVDLIGFNKGFVVSLLFDEVKLDIEVTGVLDKNSDGEFLGLGTNPPNK